MVIIDPKFQKSLIVLICANYALKRWRLVSMYGLGAFSHFYLTHEYTLNVEQKLDHPLS